jgi:tryptophan-rich sensory protein
MMGVAAGLVWDRIDFEKSSKESFGVFAIQLVKCFVVVLILITHNLC